MHGPSRRLSLPLITIVAAIAFSGTALADPPPPTVARAKQVLQPLGHQMVEDAVDLGTAPLRWRRHEWLRFGEGVAAVLAAYTVDNQITTFVSHQQNHVLNSYLRIVTQIGDGSGIGIAAIMAGGGFFAQDDRMMDAGIDALESTAVASGIVTPVIKLAVGRARPRFGLGKHSFHPFNGAYPSFPSGHATNAFAIASAIATRYDDTRWVPAVAYTLATSVAIARVHDRAHFASDVIAGGLIGRAIAKSIVASHRRARVAFIPTWNGAIVDIRF